MLELNKILGVRCHKMPEEEMEVVIQKKKRRIPVLSDELHTVIDEDESDFAELGFLFRVQKRVVQGVAQLLQDRQENSAYLECEEETKDQNISGKVFYLS